MSFPIPSAPGSGPGYPIQENPNLKHVQDDLNKLSQLISSDPKDTQAISQAQDQLHKDLEIAGKDSTLAQYQKVLSDLANTDFTNTSFGGMSKIWESLSEFGQITHNEFNAPIQPSKKPQ